MTTQHAQHTPLGRAFFSLPKTLLGWLAVGLVAVSPAFLILSIALTSGNVSGDAARIPLVLYFSAGVAGFVVASLALLRGLERSALVLIAMLLGLPTMILGYLLMSIAFGSYSA